MIATVLRAGKFSYVFEFLAHPLPFILRWGIGRGSLISALRPRSHETGQSLMLSWTGFKAECVIANEISGFLPGIIIWSGVKKPLTLTTLITSLFFILYEVALGVILKWLVIVQALVDIFTRANFIKRIRFSVNASTAGPSIADSAVCRCGFGQKSCSGSCREEAVRNLTSLRRLGRLLTCTNTANVGADTAKLAVYPKKLRQWLWLFLALFCTHTYLWVEHSEMLIFAC